jgi:hypothetical protein
VEWIVDALPARWGRSYADARFFLIPDDEGHVAGTGPEEGMESERDIGRRGGSGTSHGVPHGLAHGAHPLEFFPLAWFEPPADARERGVRSLGTSASLSPRLYRVFVIAYPKSPPPDLPAVAEVGAGDVPLFRIEPPRPLPESSAFTGLR